MREKDNLNRPTTAKERKFGMRCGLPTLFRRVELAFVRQSEKHTYQFTGSQRECSFMLMSSHISKFLIIESLISQTIIYSTDLRKMLFSM